MSCKNCLDRRIGCHGTCECYAKFVEENEKLKAKKIEEAENRSITFESMIAIKKRKRTK